MKKINTNLRQIINHNRPKRKEIPAKILQAYRQQIKILEKEIKTLSTTIAQQQQQFYDYRDANKDAYEQAEIAQEQRRFAEQTLLTIGNFILEGDEVPLQMLKKIDTEIDNYFNYIKEQNKTHT